MVVLWLWRDQRRLFAVSSRRLLMLRLFNFLEVLGMENSASSPDPS